MDMDTEWGVPPMPACVSCGDSGNKSIEYFNSSDGNPFTDLTGTKPNTAEIVVNSVLLCIGVCANIWMIRSLYKSWKPGSRMHFYLLAICIADVLGLCIRCGVNIGINSTVAWRGGYSGCKIFAGIQMFGTTMSHLILAGFNIDNLFTIFRSRSIKALRIVFLLLSLVAAFFISGNKFYFYRLVPLGYSNEALFCGLEGFDLLPLVEAVLCFLLPFLIILLFGLPSFSVWCCRKVFILQKMTSGDNSSTDLQHFGRDIRMVFAYDVVFFICCAPIVVFEMIGGRSVDAFTALTFLEAANACLNPFIYAISNYTRRRRERTAPDL